MLKLLGWPNSAPWLVGGALILLMISVWVHQIRQCRQDKNGSSEKHEKAYQEIAPRQPYPNEEEHRASEKAYWVRSIVAQYRTPWLSIFTAAAAAVAAGAAFFTYEQTRRQVREAHTQSVAILQANQMNAESGRAWIAPGELHITQPLTTADAGIVGRLNYTNPGREPATEVKIRGAFAVVRYPEGKGFDDLDFPDLTEISCGIAAPKQATIAFPTMPPNGFAIDIPGKTENIGYMRPFTKMGTKLPFKFQPLQDVIDQKGVLIAIACFNYVTTQKERLTMVCYLLQPSAKPMAQWEWHFCPTGQKAT